MNPHVFSQNPSTPPTTSSSPSDNPPLSSVSAPEASEPSVSQSTTARPTPSRPQLSPLLSSSPGYRCISQRQVPQQEKNTPPSATEQFEYELTQSSASNTLGSSVSSTSSNPSITASHINNVNILNSTTSSPSKTSTAPKFKTKRSRRGDKPEIVSPPPQPEPPSLTDFLYQRGFLRGEGSDVTVRAFNRDFKLHKLILSRSSYFESLFSAYWTSSSSSSSSSNDNVEPPVHNLCMDHDENITERALELALSRLYGHEDLEEERANVFGLFAVANFLDLPDLVEFCVDEIITQIGYNTVAGVLRFFHRCHYGPASKQIVEACNNFLFSNGYEMSMEQWEDIPNEVVADVIGNDAFFVPNEWTRCLFLMDMINWKMETIIKKNVQIEKTNGTMPSTPPTNISPTSSLSGKTKFKSKSVHEPTYQQLLTKEDQEALLPLKLTLNHDIRYCHMTYSELESLDKARDVCNRRMISRHVLRDAVWLQTALRNKVVQSTDSNIELGLVEDVTNDKFVFDSDDEGYQDEQDGESESEMSYSQSPSDKVQHFDALKETKKTYSNNRSSSAVNPFTDFEEDEDEDIMYYPVPALDETLDTHLHRKNRKCAKATRYPPFRFSVKFDDVALLQNDRRMYSQTYWYAGSYWNVYIQKVAYRNRHQLGVYIHRGPMEPENVNNANTSTTNPFSNNFDSQTRLRLPAFQSNNNAPGTGGYPLQTQQQHATTQQEQNVQTYGSLYYNMISNTATGGEFGQMAVTDFRRRPLGSLNNTTSPEAARVDLNRNIYGAFRAPSPADHANTSRSDNGQTPMTLYNAVYSTPEVESLNNLVSGMEISINTPAAITINDNVEANSEGRPRQSQDISMIMAQQGGGVGDITEGELFEETFFDALRAPSNEEATAVNPLTEAANSIRISRRLPSEGSNDDTCHNQATPPQRVPDYLDHRKKLTAFFEIYTPSRKGHSTLTCFSSTPDQFNIMQSWGWKSASLYAKVEELRREEKKKNLGSDGLKFMVSIGLV